MSVFALGTILGGRLVAQDSPLSSAASKMLGTLGASVAHAQGSEETPVSPTEARERDVYYPNSEDLAPDEMRVIACGTGMPTTRASQAAACWQVRLHYLFGRTLLAWAVRRPSPPL